MIENRFIRRFFIEHVTMHLVPIIIVLTLLSFITYRILNDTVTSKIDSEHEQQVAQMKMAMEMLFQEEDTLNLTMIASAIEFTQLRDIFSEPYPDPSMMLELAKLKTFIDSPAIGKDYIDSIYVYVENEYNRFITSSQGGIVDAQTFPDSYWLQSYKSNQRPEKVWIEKRYTYGYGLMGEVDVTPVISVFHRATLKDNSSALMVLNIKEQYIKEQILKQQTDNGQYLLVLDQHNHLLTSNKFIPSDWQKQFPTFTNGMTLSHKETNYLTYMTSSEKYQLQYVSINKEDTSLHQYRRTLFIVAGLAVAIVLLFAVIQTANISRFLHSITKLFQHAKLGQQVPPPHEAAQQDIYSYISDHLIENFIQQEYLKTKVTSIKYEKQAAQLTMLQAQLNPHFLYNTLESINWRTTALVGHYNPVNEMIEHLSDILRYALEEPGNIVPFAVEQAYSNHYLAIQQIRFNHSFDVMWDVDEEAQQRKVLKLLFQPILENTLFHAFHNGEIEGKIKIKVRCTEAHTNITIIDNGVGMSKEQLAVLRERLIIEEITSKHIGVLNTHMRLKIVYDNNFAFRIQSKEHWGTMFTIQIPNEPAAAEEQPQPHFHYTGGY